MGSLSNREVLGTIEWEGGVVETLGTIPADQIDDPEVAALWLEAAHLQSELDALTAKIMRLLRDEE